MLFSNILIFQLSEMIIQTVVAASIRSLHCVHIANISSSAREARRHLVLHAALDAPKQLVLSQLPDAQHIISHDPVHAGAHHPGDLLDLADPPADHGDVVPPGSHQLVPHLNHPVHIFLYCEKD